MKTTERRQNLKEALIAAAERTIEVHGLSGMKARDLAAEVGCAVGAIYNVVTDLDDLVLAVNERTLATLEAELGVVMDSPKTAAEAIVLLIHRAHTYLRFAAAHTKRWRAVFDHRLPEKRELPAQYRNLQQRLFTFIEQPLRILSPNLSQERFALLTRSLFSAMHGMVLLGLEEKLGAISLKDLEEQMAVILTALGTGFAPQLPH